MPDVSAREFFNNGTDIAQKVVGVAGGTPLPVSGSVSPATPMSATPMQGATLLNQKTTSAANTAQAQVLAGAANQRVTLRKIVVFASAAPTAYAVTVDNGAGVVLDLGTSVAVASGPAIFDLGAAGLSAPTGNSITVNVGAAGVGITTTLSLIADRS